MYLTFSQWISPKTDQSTSILCIAPMLNATLSLLEVCSSLTIPRSLAWFVRIATSASLTARNPMSNNTSIVSFPRQSLPKKAVGFVLASRSFNPMGKSHRHYFRCLGTPSIQNTQRSIGNVSFATLTISSQLQSTRHCIEQQGSRKPRTREV